MLTIDNAVKTYRAHNMRVTPQRLAVLDEMIGNHRHPTAETIASHVQTAMPNVSLSTVYKTLNELVDLGLLRRVDVSGSSSGARFDPTTSEHGHLLCSMCGDLTDVDVALSSSLDYQAIEEDYGVEVDSGHVELTGICAACLGKNK